jgi:hypothetical protein
VKKMDAPWGITLHRILQEVRRMCKTRNQLTGICWLCHGSPTPPLCSMATLHLATPLVDARVWHRRLSYPTRTTAQFYLSAGSSHQRNAARFVHGRCAGLVASRGPTCYAATTWRCCSTRPGWRGGPREEPRALRDGCGSRRHMVHPSRHVPQGHPLHLSNPSIEEKVLKEGP